MPRKAKCNQFHCHHTCKRKHYYKNDKAGDDVRDDKRVMEIKMMKSKRNIVGIKKIMVKEKRE
eukprot:10207840-Ditylum_brightwellii.AAC.1